MIQKCKVRTGKIFCEAAPLFLPVKVFMRSIVAFIEMTQLAGVCEWTHMSTYN